VFHGFADFRKPLVQIAGQGQTGGGPVEVKKKGYGKEP